MDGSDFYTREPADFPNLPPRARRRVGVAVLAVLASIVAVCLNVYLREVTASRLRLTVDWQPPAVDYE